MKIAGIFIKNYFNQSVSPPVRYSGYNVRNYSSVLQGDKKEYRHKSIQVLSALQYLLLLAGVFRSLSFCSDFQTDPPVDYVLS